MPREGAERQRITALIRPMSSGTRPVNSPRRGVAREGAWRPTVRGLRAPSPKGQDNSPRAPVSAGGRGVSMRLSRAFAQSRTRATSSPGRSLRSPPQGSSRRREDALSRGRATSARQVRARIASMRPILITGQTRPFASGPQGRRNCQICRAKPEAARHPGVSTYAYRRHSRPAPPCRSRPAAFAAGFHGTTAPIVFLTRRGIGRRQHRRRSAASYPPPPPPPPKLDGIRSPLPPPRSAAAADDPRPLAAQGAPLRSLPCSSVMDFCADSLLRTRRTRNHAVAGLPSWYFASTTFPAAPKSRELLRAVVAQVPTNPFSNALLLDRIHTPYSPSRRTA